MLCSLTGAPLNETGVNVDSLSRCGRLVEEDVPWRRPECVSVTPCWRDVSETTSRSSAELLLFVQVAVSLLEDFFLFFCKFLSPGSCERLWHHYVKFGPNVCSFIGSKQLVTNGINTTFNHRNVDRPKIVTPRPSGDQAVILF